MGGDEVETVENVIEEVSPTGDAVWSWNSWDHLTIDPDCLGYRYGLNSDPPITAHINALTLIDGDVVASSRGCAQVVRINRSANSETDPGTDLVWQLGGTDQDADDRAFLAISGDESGRNEFCRQHHATETASGTVVLFDNGVDCLSEEIGEPPKRSDLLPAFSRAVEYDIDPATGTAEFLREVRLDRRYGYAPFTGSVDILENGHWLINWGYLREADSSLSAEEYSIAISEVDAAGTELLQVKAWADGYRYSTFRVYRESEADVEIPLNLPVTLMLESAQAAESAGEMVFAVEPNVASSEEITVDYETANGTAMAGQDYTAQSGTLTFPANSTTPQTITVPILNDDVAEAEEETFTVRLRNATKATLAGGGTTLDATGTIIDDATAPPPPPPPRPSGSLENPGPASFQSGIGLLSGWVCDAAVVELEINGGPRMAAAYGTDRADTAPVCGDTNNGFGLLFNWNLLGDGEHTVRAVADGEEFGRATFMVTTLGVEFLQGTHGETVVKDFPSPGEAVRLVWQQAQQNFVLAPLSQSSGGP